MGIKIIGNINLPVSDEGIVINPDISLLVKNLTAGILTIRTDIDPLGNSHIALYGNMSETNNRNAIEYWVHQKLEKKEHSFINLIVEFHYHHLEIEREVQIFLLTSN